MDKVFGEYRKDGSFVGFCYAKQLWVDTKPTARRDADREPGSACNPLSSLPVDSVIDTRGYL